MIFIDSNVLIDLIDPVEEWNGWSQSMIEAAAGGRLIINAIVFAEIARQFASISDELHFLSEIGIESIALDDGAAFAAGKAHAAYRAAGGSREGVLADFLIGGHASALDATLLTRDRARFTTYFPDLILITPESDNG